MITWEEFEYLYQVYMGSRLAKSLERDELAVARDKIAALCRQYVTMKRAGRQILTETLREEAAKRGVRGFTRSQLKVDEVLPSAKTVNMILGGKALDECLRAAGLYPIHPTNQELEHALCDLYEFLGRTPKNSEINGEYIPYVTSTYHTRFGSLKAAHQKISCNKRSNSPNTRNESHSLRSRPTVSAHSGCAQ